MKRYLPAIAMLALFLVYPAWADDVTDQMDEASKAYKKKDFSTASMALDTALTLIRQKRAESLSKLLPEPLSGWSAKKAGSKAIPKGMFGGGITAERIYSKGKEKITISFATDSPMLQTMSMMFTNPMFAGSSGLLEIVDGKKAMYKQRDNSYMLIVANRLLVTVKGNRKTDKPAVKSYLKAIDFAALEKSAL